MNMNDELRAISAVVTSGDEDSEKLILSDANSDDDEVDEDETTRTNREHYHGKDEPFLYDSNVDDEDEAYVYKYLRSGVEELVTVVRQDNEDPTRSVQDTIKMFKPRRSDAVLSCPCCFHTVCMDCQRHETYSNQFRAMFVMGIVVRWDLKLVHDPVTNQLLPLVDRQDEYGMVTSDDGGHSEDEAHVHIDDIQTQRWAHGIEKIRNGQIVYYTISCGSCQTVVAALDMTEEVYHFFGCIASA